MSIACDDLSYRFGARTALDRVTFAVSSGEVVGLLGANGAGKSTLMRVLCGLLTPASGTAHVAGFDLSGNAARARSQTGYVAQKFGLYDDLSVLENLRFYGRAYGLDRKTAAERVSASLHRFGLNVRKNDPTASLSHGWRQRVAMASALLHQPRVLLIDEGTAGLDPAARRHVWNVIEQEAARGAAVLISTHHLDEAQRCPRVLWLHEARVAGEGAYAELAGRLDELFASAEVGT